jgi:hypothetical protein
LSSGPGQMIRRRSALLKMDGQRVLIETQNAMNNRITACHSREGAHEKPLILRDARCGRSSG